MGLRAGRESHDLSAVASLPKVSPLAIHAPRPEDPAEVRQKHIGGTGYSSFAWIVPRAQSRQSRCVAVQTLKQWRFEGGGALPTKHEPNYSKILVPVTFTL